MVHRLGNFFSNILRSDTFFVFVIVWFVLGSLWVATASLYPMAFDEEFHFGLIKIYGDHLLPFGIEPTRDMAQYGAATADPSYLFHYLMSFPYRLLDSLGFSEITTIILLRTLNIAMVVGALIFYRKAFLAGRLSKAATNGVIAAFSLIPILPLMAGQLNYDNLLLLLTAISFWLLIRITNYVKTHVRLPVLDTILLVGTLLLMLPVKYASMPLVLGAGLWLLWLCVLVVKKHGFTSAIKELSSLFGALSTALKVSLIGLVLLGSFFNIRYVDNYIRYDSFIPGCDTVFDKDACQAYGPWQRNNRMIESKSADFQPKSFIEFMYDDWVPGMMQRLVFTLAGPTNGYQTRSPLPLVWPLGVLFIVAGMLALLRFWRQLVTRWSFVTPALLISAVYVGVLAVKLYGSYLITAVPVAINGRYLLPVIPLLFAIFVYAVLHAGRYYRIYNYTVLGLSLMLVTVAIQGGGVFTYIVRGYEHWFWEGWGQASWLVLHNIVSFFTWQHIWFI